MVPKSEPQQTPTQLSCDSDQTSNTSDRRARQTFALLIGINEYKHGGQIIRNLSGCKNDVEDIGSFLQDTLLVPKENIVKLLDAKATVAGIVEALQFLVKDNRIIVGDAIVIFYAGHGAEVSPHKLLDSDGKKMQLLAPYDFRFKPKSKGTDANDSDAKEPHAIEGERVGATVDFDAVENGLLDFELGELLQVIADEKGNNITLILDCCHSGSGTRGSGNADEAMFPRGIDLPEGTRLSSNVSPVTRGSSIPKVDANRGLSSHVLLAATTPSGNAYEKDNRGMFTSSLTKLLRSDGSLEMTYEDLISRLSSIPHQKPQCEGNNKHRIFLQDRSVGPPWTPYPVFYDTKLSRYTIHAGEAHGVTTGDKITIHDTSFNMLGHVVVTDTKAYESFVYGTQTIQIPETGAFVTWMPAQQIRVFLKDSVLEKNVLERLGREMADEKSGWTPTFIFVGLQERPALVISGSSEGTVCFELIDQACVQAGFSNIFDSKSHVTDEATLKAVLRGVVHFHWYLNLKSLSPIHVAEGNAVEEGVNLTGREDQWINLECFQLVVAAVNPTNARVVRKPKSGNLIQDGEVTIINPSGEAYGFRITNMTETPLFVSVFHFDMTDFSIVPYYVPPARDGHDACLSPQGELTIGYGTSGTPAREYSVPSRQSLDIGYVKLFLSNRYVDYSNISQSSPGNKRTDNIAPDALEVWFTLGIRIIMRRE